MANFFADIQTALKESEAVGQTLQVLINEMNSGGEHMTLAQIEAAAKHAMDVRPHVAGVAAGTGATLVLKATGVFRGAPVWKSAAIVMPVWGTAFAMGRVYTNFQFVRTAMRDDRSSFSRKLRNIYRKYAPPQSTTLAQL
ncbi:transmembrane protein [Cystoisospora suis]|uniref:Transmembrane protein n=1 Tax=Cystoisospora suis TaxID=483139 RepID=A0A2C6L9C7_9APIC|nr:transmembrane protein [Cystoisospora suis]